MKEENEITEEVRQLLDSLEQHGQNVRRQKELGDLIDRLERKTENGERKTFHFPLSTFRFYWWIVGAAAACLLLWLLAKPSMKETPNMDEEILVEETITKDTMTTQREVDITEEAVILEEPVTEKLLAKEKPIQPAKQKANLQKPTEMAIEKDLEEQWVASNTSVEPERIEPTDTSNIGSNTMSSSIENLSTFNSHLSPSQRPQRRVIRSLNLVCYECKVENGKRKMESSQFSVIRSPFEPDPNMKNGSLAFEVKLH